MPRRRASCCPVCTRASQWIRTLAGRWAGPPPVQSTAFNGGGGVSVGEAPRITNLVLADVVESLSPKSAITFAAGYGVVHFYGDITDLTGAPANVSFIGSSEETVQFGYNRILNPQ